MLNNTKSHLLPNQEKWITLTVKEVKRIFCYYLFLLIISFLWFIFDLVYQYELNDAGFSNIVGTIVFAFPCGVVGATIYYIRKLYKSCLQDLVVNSNVLDYHKLGAKVYFYFRPIISGILSVLICIGIISGFYIFNNNLSINDNRFFLFISLISFYIGYCNGKIIIKIDEYGESIINLVFKENKDE